MGRTMTNNMQLDDAIEAIEDLLNSSKASYVIDAIRNLKCVTNKENAASD